MKAANNLPTSFVVVVLGSMWVGPQFVDEGAVLEVERAVRNDWIGSKLARDATDEEVAAYRADQDDGTGEWLETDRSELIEEIKTLAAEKADLAAERDTLQAAVAELGKQKDTLAGEVETLEARKAAAEKPAAKATAK